MAVPAALGLDPTTANSVHRIINEGVGSILPSGLQRVILDGIFTIGSAPLSESLLNENNPLGSSRLANLRRIFEEGKSLQLQFPAEDLGFSVRGVEARSKASLVPWENYIDVAEVKKSSNSSSWWDICQMTDKGAILVRPDEHVAWRLKSGVVRDPITEMRRVFSATLGVKPHTKHQETDGINL